MTTTLTPDDHALLTSLAIQVIAEKETDPPLWQYLDTPAVPPPQAHSLAPDLAHAVHSGIEYYSANPRLEPLPIHECEEVAGHIADQLPPDQRRALAQASRRGIARNITST